MIRGLIDLLDLILLWGFWYVISFLVLVFGIVYITKSNPTPIINDHYSTVEVIEPPKKVIVEEKSAPELMGAELLIMFVLTVSWFYLHISVL